MEALSLQTQRIILFWAVRGGGGNFGIVTSLLYRACPVKGVVGGPMFWDLSDAREVLEWHAEFMPTASEDLYGFFAFLKALPANPFPAHLQSTQTGFGLGRFWVAVAPVMTSPNDAG
jgi:hypothetical protein